MQIPPLAIENGMRTPTFEKKISDSTFLFRIFWLFLSEILSRRCRLSRTTSWEQAILLKKLKFSQAKNAFFLLSF